MSKQHPHPSQPADESDRLIRLIIHCQKMIDFGRPGWEKYIGKLIGYKDELVAWHAHSLEIAKLEAQIEEINKFVRRSDSLSEEKYAVRRLAEIQAALDKKKGER